MLSSLDIRDVTAKTSRIHIIFGDLDVEQASPIIAN